MAERRPLVLASGRPSELPAGDTMPQSAVTSLTTDLAAKETLSATSITNSAIGIASAALAVTTSVLDIPGASVTITTVVPNTVVIVTGVFDVSANNTTGAAVCTGYLNVDGVEQPAVATFLNQVTGVTAFRATVMQTWRVTLPTAGAHTLKLRATRTASTAGTHTINGTHTSITVLGRF